MIDLALAILAGAFGAAVFDYFKAPRSVDAPRAPRSEGPFFHRKPSARKKPVAHDERDEWLKEQEDRRV